MLKARISRLLLRAKADATEALPRPPARGGEGIEGRRCKNSILLFPLEIILLCCKSVAACLFGSNRGTLGQARSGFILENQ